MEKVRQRKIRNFRPDEALFDRFEELIGLASWSPILEALILHYIESDEATQKQIQARLIQWRKENGKTVNRGRPTSDAKHLNATMERLPGRSGKEKRPSPSGSKS